MRRKPKIFSKSERWIVTIVLISIATVSYTIFENVYSVRQVATINQSNRILKPMLQVLQSALKKDLKKEKPNELGDILVVMYHGRAESHPTQNWLRSKKEFLADLTALYENQYYLVSMSDYVNNTMKIPTGKTPIVITFDDGYKSTFSIQKGKQGWIVNPDSLIGILEDFKKTHSGFGSGGIVYMCGVLLNIDPFFKIENQGTIRNQLELLYSLGYEAGNHTYDHFVLERMDSEEVQAQISRLNYAVEKNCHRKVVHLAYPYGIRPKDSLIKYVKKGTYDNKPYRMMSAVREAPRYPYFVPPGHKEFDPYNISRALGSNGENWDLNWYIQYYKDNPEEKYISDGLDNIMLVPEEDSWDIDYKQIHHKKVMIYNSNTGEIMKEKDCP